MRKPGAGLPGAENVAFSAQLEVLLGEEAVLGLAHDVEPPWRFRQRRL
jgi:hypothetical protein